MAKNTNGRTAFKNDSSENWKKATGFIPEPGEFFLVNDEACPIVIGDGVTPASELCEKPLFKSITSDEIEKLFGGDE